MPIGLIQLMCKGTEDNYLINNPQINYFKKIYKKHTNFTQYLHKIPIENNKFNSIEEIILDLHGDLIQDISLITNIDGVMLNKVSIYNIIKKISLIFGNQTINTIYPELLLLNNNLYYENNQKAILDFLSQNMLENYNITNIYLNNNNITCNNLNIIDYKANQYFILYNYSNIYKFITNINQQITFYSNNEYTEVIQHLQDNNVTTLLNENLRRRYIYYLIRESKNIIKKGIIHIYQDYHKNDKQFYINLPFYFCNNSSLSIPYFLMLYSEIKLKVEFNNFNELISKSKNEIYSNLFEKPKLKETYLLINYIILDKDERQYIANSNPQFLINTVQHTTFPIKTSVKGTIQNNFELKFLDNMTTSLLWYVKDITFNNIELKNKNYSIKYDNNYYSSHKILQNKLDLPKEFNLYNFAFNLNDYQPSGHLNTSYANFHINFYPIYKPNTIYFNIINNKFSLFGDDINITNNQINLYTNINYNFIVLNDSRIFITDYIITDFNSKPIYYKYFDYINNKLLLENIENPIKLYLYDNLNNYIEINIEKPDNIIIMQKKINIFSLSYNILSFKNGNCYLLLSNN